MSVQRINVRGEYIYGPTIRTDYRQRISWARVLGHADRLELIEWMIGREEYEALYDEGVELDRLGRLGGHNKPAAT